MTCHRHPRRDGNRRCIKCEQTWCDDCLVSPAAMPSVKMCPVCRDMTVVAGRRKTGSFFDDIALAFTYPFRGTGWITFLAGWLALAVLYGVSQRSAVVGISGLLLTNMCLSAYLVRVVVSSSNGDEEMPPWPEISSFWGDIFMPAFRYGFVLFLCVLPPAIQWGAGMKGAAIATGLLSAYYLPMAWLAVSLHESLLAATPGKVFGAIAKVPYQYPVAALAVGVVLLGGEMASMRLSEMGMGAAALGYGVGLYLGFVVMRILGRLYYRNEESFDWFGEASTWR